MKRSLILLAAMMFMAGASAQNLPGDVWKIVPATELGFNETKLKTGLEALSGNVAIVRRGFLCATQRGDITAPVKLYSVGKSITALVGGALIQQGRITLDTLVDGTDSPTPPKAAYRHLMSMTSDYGLTPHAPGKHYAYNNEGVQFYGVAMDQQFFGSIGPAAVLQKVFWDTIGRQDEVKFGGYWSGWDGGFAISARDCARLGLLVQRRGEWGGKRILPASFVDALYVHQIPRDATENRSTGQAPGTSNKWNQQQFSRNLRDGYSFGFWLLQGSRLALSAVIAADGRGGNYIIIAPRHELVIAVTNYQIDPSPPRAEEYLDAVLVARTSAQSN